MGINADVRLYLNTGFNGSNIPDSLSLLEGSRFHDCQGAMLRQAARTDIKVEITDDIAAQVDYVKIDKGGNNRFVYFCTGYIMLSPKTCQLMLQIDSITTVGCLSRGSNAVDGWLTRRTKPNSEIQDVNKASKLTLSEPWGPTEELIEDYQNNIVGAMESPTNTLIQATTDLVNLTPKATDYASDDGKYVTVPDLSKATESTLFMIQSANGALNSSFSTAGMGIYNGRNSKVQKGIQAMWALGIPTIKYSYLLPQKYGGILEGDGFCSAITSLQGYTTSTIPVLPEGYTPENYKAALIHQRIGLLSTSTPSSASYTLAQLGGQLKFTYWADPTPKGNPFCRPMYVKGNDNLLYGAVMGSNWITAPYASEGAFGWKIDEKDYNLGIDTNSHNFWTGLLTGGGQMADIPTPNSNPNDSEDSDSAKKSASNNKKDASLTSQGFSIGNIAANVYGGIARGFQNLRTYPLMYDRTTNLRSPDISFAASPGMQNFVGNDFTVVRSRLTDNDIRRFDEFLHKYGEATDEEFDISKVYTRSKYDYIQCTRVFVRTEHPRWLTNEAAAQLQGGIRVWHVKPNVSALQIGGN